MARKISVIADKAARIRFVRRIHGAQERHKKYTTKCHTRKTREMYFRLQEKSPTRVCRVHGFVPIDEEWQWISSLQFRFCRKGVTATFIGTNGTTTFCNLFEARYIWGGINKLGLCFCVWVARSTGQTIKRQIKFFLYYTHVLMYIYTETLQQETQNRSIFTGIIVEIKTRTATCFGSLFIRSLWSTSESCCALLFLTIPKNVATVVHLV